jgi:SAM-dependent methyltransferase
LYEATASASDWLAVHRWNYDERIAGNVAQDIRQKLMLAPGERVLEIGCATGAKLSLVVHPGQRGVGFDLCEALVRRSGDFAIDRDRLRLGVAEAARLPLKSGAFDKVFCYSVFQCFPSRTYAHTVMAEAMRVCKAHGIILIGDIFGSMEKQRQYLWNVGVPPRFTEAILWPLAPIWHAKHVLCAPTDGVRRRVYPRGFFRRALANENCDVQFLLQDIPGRGYGNTRYDVRIQKQGPSGGAAGREHPAAASSVGC